MNKLLFSAFLLLALSTIVVNTYGQVSNLSIDEVYDKYRDSLKTTPYPWILPIMGAKVRKLGFDIPYPVGVMVTYGHSRQQLTIDNLAVSFNPDNLVDVSSWARLQSMQANVDAAVARADVWLLPFLNVFGVVGRIRAISNVHLGLPIDLKFNVTSEGTNAGWGTVVAGGVGPMVMTGNFVQNWTWTGALGKPSMTTLFDARVGYMKRFRRKPDMNLVFLVGASYLGLSRESSGSADLEKLVGITPEGKQEAADQLDAWYGELTDPAQELLGGIYDGLSSWLRNDESSFLYYKFDKSLYYPISMTVGVNYQLNHRWMFNGIYTFLGSREQITLSLNYRFGFRGKNFLEGLTL
jgi:hypothetical protein